MPKNAIADFDTTPANNTDIGGIAITGSSAVQNFDDAFRTFMAYTKTLYNSTSAFMRTVLDDADASAVLTTLGFSAFIKTLVDDADAATARTTLGFYDGEFEKIQTTTVSSPVSVVNFAFNATLYSSYKVEFEDVRGSASNVGLVMRTYNPALMTTSVYSRLVIFSSQTIGGSGSVAPSGTQDTATSLALTGAIGSGSSTGTGSGMVKLTAFASPAFKAFQYNTISLSDASVQFMSSGHGHISTNSALTAVDFYMSSGNIAAGKFILYGVRK